MSKKVLFLCTGNSCRSQTAESIVNAHLGSKWQATSTGTKPTGYIHPKALAVLAKIGIRHTGRSKSVVTVCDSAAEERPLCLEKASVSITAFPTRRRLMT